MASLQIDMVVDCGSSGWGHLHRVWDSSSFAHLIYLE